MVVRSGREVHVPENRISAVVGRLVRDVFFQADFLDIEEEQVWMSNSIHTVELRVAYRGLLHRDKWQDHVMTEKLFFEEWEYEAKVSHLKS